VLRHPFIVQFRGCYLSPNLSLMVSELMENGSLKNFLDSPEGQLKLQVKQLEIN
jgi:serine/threonine protein kinase